MERLININENEQGGQSVSARELHQFLEVNTDFTTWCSRMFEYGFSAQLDFTPILGKSQGGRPSADYALTMDCAKQIAMIQRSEKGRLAREYFLEVERLYKQQLMAPALVDPSAVSRRALAQMVIDAENRIDQLNLEVGQLEKVVVSQAKKVAYVDEVLTAQNGILTTSIAKDLGMGSITLNKLLYKLGVQYKVDNHWVLYHQYQNKGYTKTETHPYQSKSGQTLTSLNTVWTELGRAFVVKKVMDYRARMEAAEKTALAAHQPLQLGNGQQPNA